MQILFLTQILPYPLNTGAKVRAYYVLRYLAQRHTVTLVSFVRSEDQAIDLDHLRSFCQNVHIVPIMRSHMRNGVAVGNALIRGEPVVIARDRFSAMYSKLAELVAKHHFDAVHADQTSMVQYALWSANRINQVHGRIPLRILDAHNAFYMVVERLAQQAGNPVWRRFLEWEARRINRFERSAYGRFDQVVFVTAVDRDRLHMANALVIPICADPAATLPVTRRPDAMDVTFVGALHWPPNAQGITWFTRTGWPIVQAKLPSANLRIIGKAPPPEVTALASDLAHVTVTGYLADLRPYLADTGVFLVPLQAGGGMRVKIVDAWTWGLPVVSTTIGAEGTCYRDGQNLLVADDPAELAAATVRILEDPALAMQLSTGGRKTVEDSYNWQVIYRAWDQVYQR